MWSERFDVHLFTPFQTDRFAKSTASSGWETQIVAAGLSSML
jgi:hypothetical protein